MSETVPGKTVLGVIGGSGFYQMKGLTAIEQVELTTPFGRPSDPFSAASLGNATWFFSRATVVAIG